MTPYKIVIADDHQVVIDGVLNMLEEEQHLVVAKTIISTENLLPILHLSKPDVLILDVNMGGVNTFEIVPEIKKIFSELKIIAFTSYDEPVLKKEAKSIGIDGYLTKNAGKEQLINTIYSVLANEISIKLPWTIQHKTGVPDDKFLLQEKLSKRELEILKLVGKGHTSQQIGEILFISKQTVQWHRKNIVAKLQLKTPSEMIKIAHDYGLV